MSCRLTLTSIIIALPLCIAARAHAQDERSRRIEGIVFDSVHARPLAGAHVVAVGGAAQSEVYREAMSDSAGRYRIDSLAAGRYVVGFESALLDSLEVTVSPREANLTAAQVATIDLALPSAAKLRSTVCFGAALPADSGVILGHVVSAETESPLAGVTIAMQWRDLSVDRKTLRPIKRERSDSVITDKDGWYRMCGVPTGAWISVQIQHAQYTGPTLRARVDDTLGIAIRHLSFSPSESAVAVDSGVARTDGMGAVARSGTAALSGRVLGPTNEPVPRADVRVRGAAGGTRTDSTGRYSLGQLPAGTQILDVRRFGYEVAEVQVELRSGVTTTKDVQMRRYVVTLDTMRSVAARYPEFEQHRYHTAYRGQFFGPEELQKMNPTYTSDIIQRVQGITVEGRGPQAKVGRYRGGRFVCSPNIVVNDVEGWSLADVHPKDIGAIELYAGSERDPPGLFAPWLYDKGCGVILIWMKKR
ncbi:MAG TPA: carboxypeptidase-like regulatory domain-containing protein [Gemmatimonadaceae bacterium]